MDSLTQIVLGAAVGEAVLGKKVGNKAMLFGAVGGTLPDLDVLARYFTDTVTAIEWHRGFSHSLFFSILAAPVLGWLVWRMLPKKEATRSEWSWLFFWCLFTHPLLDAFTTWGTQLFWPFKTRLAFQSIFVIDPLYTLPFLVFLMLAMRQKRTDPKRGKYNKIGLMISSSYLLLTLIFKGLAHQQFSDALKDQGVVYEQLNSRPTPFNIILWNANIDAGDRYLLGEYSFFDSQAINFRPYPKNHTLLGSLETNGQLVRLKDITEGWYTISDANGKLYFNDLRFGLMSLDEKETKFAFSYEIDHSETGLIITEMPKRPRDTKALFKSLWTRIWGN